MSIRIKNFNKTQLSFIQFDTHKSFTMKYKIYQINQVPVFTLGSNDFYVLTLQLQRGLYNKSVTGNVPLMGTQINVCVVWTT